jgi:hypothetical protein
MSPHRVSNSLAPQQLVYRVPHRERSVFILLRWSVIDVRNMCQVPMEGSHTSHLSSAPSLTIAWLLRKQ